MDNWDWISWSKILLKYIQIIIYYYYIIYKEYITNTQKNETIKFGQQWKITKWKLLLSKNPYPIQISSWQLLQVAKREMS